MLRNQSIFSNSLGIQVAIFLNSNCHIYVYNLAYVVQRRLCCIYFVSFFFHFKPIKYYYFFYNLEFEEVDHCGGNIFLNDDNATTIYSPNFPLNYEQGLDWVAIFLNSNCHIYVYNLAYVVHCGMR
jgi:hypothetical protein